MVNKKNNYLDTLIKLWPNQKFRDKELSIQLSV